MVYIYVYSFIYCYVRDVCCVSSCYAFVLFDIDIVYRCQEVVYSYRCAFVKYVKRVRPFLSDVRLARLSGGDIL